MCPRALAVTLRFGDRGRLGLLQLAGYLYLVCIEALSRT